MNDNIINEYIKLIKFIKINIDKNNNKQDLFRLSQTIKILDIIKKYPTKITSGDQLKDIKGIGKNTVKRIDEILETGKLSEIKIERKNEKNSKIIDELVTVYGIGRNVAQKLILQYNITSVQDLIDKYKKGNIELTDNIILGLKYYDDIQKRIPRNEIVEIDKMLNENIKNMKISGLIHVICGSYRRGKANSGDIDVLLTNKNIITLKNFNKSENYLKMFVKKLQDKKFIIDNLNENYTKKYMGFCKYKNNPVRRIDIIYMPYESFYTSLVYFTGSGEFNKKMRSLAHELGYLLNDSGLFKIKNNKQIPIKSEKDLFDKLGMEYIEPSDRD